MSPAAVAMLASTAFHGFPAAEIRELQVGVSRDGTQWSLREDREVTIGIARRRELDEPIIAAVALQVAPQFLEVLQVPHLLHHQHVGTKISDHGAQGPLLWLRFRIVLAKARLRHAIGRPVVLDVVGRDRDRLRVYETETKREGAEAQEPEPRAEHVLLHPHAFVRISALSSLP
jgi:hypothetical protein